MPNLFIIFALFIGLFCNRTLGITYGIIFGILLDFFIGKKIGITGIMLGVVGFIGALFDKNFSKESRFTITVMILITTFIYELVLFIISCFIYKYSFDFLKFLKIATIECIYNGLITIILYPLLQKFGYKIEEEYKGKTMLTRYF